MEPEPPAQPPREAAEGFLLPGEPSVPPAPDGAAVLPPTPPPVDRDWVGRSLRFFSITAALWFLGALVALFVRGVVGDFMIVSLEVLPFAVLAALAHLGTRVSWGSYLAWLWLAFLGACMMGLVTLSGLAAVVARQEAVKKDPGLAARIPEIGFDVVLPLLLSCLVGLAVAALMLVPMIRRRLATRLPFDPESAVHTMALCLIAGASALFLGQLAATGGQPLLLVTVMADPSSFAQDGPKLLLSMLFTLCWSIPATIVAAGFPIRRTLAQALERLGMVVPTWKQVALGLGAAVLLVGIVMGLDPVVERVWTFMGWPRTDVKAFEQLLKPAITPLGAVVIGLTAGIGEEMTVRGVLQPRLGILLPNLFFVSLHALQYSWDGLLVVFLVGLALGWIRLRTNTSTACITHGTYDLILVMYSSFNPQS